MRKYHHRGKMPELRQAAYVVAAQAALISLVVISVLAVMAMRAGDPINPSTKKPAATAPPSQKAGDLDAAFELIQSGATLRVKSRRRAPLG